MKEYPELNYQFTDLKDFIRVILSLNPNKYLDKKTNQDIEKDIENDLERLNVTVVKSSVKTDKSSVKTEKGSVKTEKGSVKTSIKIIDIIEQNPFITIPKIAELLGISTRAIEKQLDKLKINGILERIGPDKGGHWEVNNK